MNKLQLRFIRVAQNKPGLTTQFEREFMESMNDKGKDYVLTKKENHILNQIQRKTS